MVDGEFRVGGLLFLGNFDSANLARVERVLQKNDSDDDSSGGVVTEPRPDYEFNVWIRPDCAGTEYENGNRSWFHFGVRGYNSNRLLRINIVNMNRQGKLYGQGYSPVTRTVPGFPRWDRIRDKPSFEFVDGEFHLTFNHRFHDVKGATTYFAFAYPWSYTECQERLAELSFKFDYCSSLPTDCKEETIYFHRECLCKSLEGRRVDLVTISSCHGIMKEREQVMDKRLFPTRSRCRRFKNKRVFFLSARVHPGETPGSFVFNGFLNFLLRHDDERAKMLRKKFVFKLIPMLNPDGVYRGHYRTDTRGVNLNRMYTDPDPVLHPAIFAVKTLMVYHHIHSRIIEQAPSRFIKSPRQSSKMSHNKKSAQDMDVDCNVMSLTPRRDKSTPRAEEDYLKNIKIRESIVDIEPLDLTDLMSSVDSTAARPRRTRSNLAESSSDSSIVSVINADTVKPRPSSLIAAQLAGLEVVGDHNPLHLQLNIDSDEDVNKTEHLGNEGSEPDCMDDSPTPRHILSAHATLEPTHPHLLDIKPEHSGIAFYVDLHGHASKRGCFIYGNNFDNEDAQVENMLYPRLIAMHTAHFDFLACNFTERNMYLRDKRDGLSKEGSGRVAVYKSIGIVHSYTLECNYNTGRLVNTIAPAYGDKGRATPPPLAGFPPKYNPSHFEDVGKAVCIAALEMTDSNPWSRMTMSEHNSLHGVRESLRRHVRGMRGQPAPPRVSRSLPARLHKATNNPAPAPQPSNRLLQRRQSTYDSIHGSDQARMTVVARKPSQPAAKPTPQQPPIRQSTRVTRRASLALSDTSSLDPKIPISVSIVNADISVEEQKVNALKSIRHMNKKSLAKVSPKIPPPVLRLTATAPADCRASSSGMPRRTLPLSSRRVLSPTPAQAPISPQNEMTSSQHSQSPPQHISLSHHSQSPPQHISLSQQNILSPTQVSLSEHGIILPSRHTLPSPTQPPKHPLSPRPHSTLSASSTLSVIPPPQTNTIAPFLKRNGKNLSRITDKINNSCITDKLKSKSDKSNPTGLSTPESHLTRPSRLRAKSDISHNLTNMNETCTAIAQYEENLAHLPDKFKHDLVNILLTDKEKETKEAENNVRMEKRQAKRIHKIYKSFNDSGSKSPAVRLGSNTSAMESDSEKKTRRRKKRSIKGHGRSHDKGKEGRGKIAAARDRTMYQKAKKDGLSQTHKRLYRQLRQKAETNHYPQYGNYTPKSLSVPSPGAHSQNHRSHYHDLTTARPYVPNHEPPTVLPHPFYDVPTKHTTRLAPQAPVALRTVDDASLRNGSVPGYSPRSPKDARSPQKVLKSSNVFLVGDKFDFITVESAENGDAKKGRHKSYGDRNNNNDIDDNPVTPRNPETGENRKDTDAWIDNIFYSPPEPSRSNVHGIEINTDPSVPEVENVEYTRDITHEYTDGDFSQYLVEEETDVTTNKYPIIRPVRTPQRQPTPKGQNTLRGMFAKKSPKTHTSYKSPGNNTLRNTVRDISFTDSKLGLGSYAQKNPNTYRKNETYSFGSNDADGFVNSQFTYEGYLRSRCLDRCKNGEMDSSSADKFLYPTYETNTVAKPHIYAESTTTFGRSRTFSDNTLDTVASSPRKASPWKKFTLRFKRGVSIDELSTSGMYSTLPV